MVKIIEKIKNFFKDKFVHKPKKKEEPKVQQKEPTQEQKVEEQKQ